MEVAKFNIQGLNFRQPDAEAVAGLARELKNLYPTGEKDRPYWKPVKGAKDFLTISGAKIFAHYVWHRANKATRIIYLKRIDNSGAWFLCSQEIDNTGLVYGDENVEYDLSYLPLTNERTARFAQIGDHLIVSILRIEPEELLVLSTSDGITICLPFNIKNTLQISYPDDVVSLSPNNSSLRYFYSFISVYCAIELLDGTMLQPTPIRLIVGQTALLEGKTEKETSYFKSPEKIIITGGYFPAAYKSIIKGLAVFISSPITSKSYGLLTAGIKTYQEVVLSDSLFFKFGTITGVFQDSDDAKRSLYISQLVTEDVLAMEKADEDILTSHSILTSEVFSYNKSLLLANAQYDYALPWVNSATADSLYIPPHERTTKFYNITHTKGSPDVTGNCLITVTFMVDYNAQMGYTNKASIAIGNNYSNISDDKYERITPVYSSFFNFMGDKHNSYVVKLELLNIGGWTIDTTYYIVPAL